MSIKMNNTIGPYIKSYNGVRPGDPLSPIFFNFVADCLIKKVENAQGNGPFTG